LIDCKLFSAARCLQRGSNLIRKNSNILLVKVSERNGGDFGVDLAAATGRSKQPAGGSQYKYRL
jgi:hypothetical protein